MRRFWRGIHSFHYMRYKKWWFVISAVVIGGGFLSMVVRGGGNPVDGLKYGLEFRSGTSITVELEGDPGVAAVRRVVTEQGLGDAVVQQSTSAETGRTGYQIQLEPMTQEQEVELREALDEDLGIVTTADGPAYASQTVGPTFGREIISASWKATIIALVLIAIYVSIRFEWKFALGAMGALAHDLLIVIVVYSLSGREITTATIAAVLTILGYSLYDNMIIFDRIRENAPRMKGLTYGDMVDRSIWETFDRSLYTMITTLLPIICLVTFGGTTLQDFAFAMLVGIITGGYSSFCVSAPIITILKEREPQYQKAAARSREARA